MIKNERIKIGLVQASASQNLDENLSKAEKSIDEASKKGADIVCLQELFASRYFAQAESKKFFSKWKWMKKDYILEAKLKIIIRNFLPPLKKPE